MIKISIVVASLNQGKYIKKNITSILSQHYPNLELIVKDGKSSDNTVKVLKSFKNKIIWSSERDSGPIEAVNSGIKQASGEIVLVIGADDYLLPKALHNVSRIFEKNSKVVWVTGDYMIVDEKGKEIRTLIPRYKKLLRNLPIKLILPVANVIPTSSTFIRRKTLLKKGLFLEKKVELACDYDMWLKLLNLSSPFILKQKLSAFRVHHKSRTVFSFDQQFNQELIILENHLKTKKHILFFLHKLHNFFVTSIYKLIGNPKKLKN